jgi:PPOX class probable F420-dependent enzyme
MTQQSTTRNPYLDLLQERSGGRGVLVTLKRDGRPQLSNVGYSYAEGDGVIRIASTEDRVKTRNLRRDARATFHVTTEDLSSYAVCECRAVVSPIAADPHDATVDELVEMYRATQGEHPDWEEFRLGKVKDRRLVIRLEIEHVYGFMFPTS